jgi:hypothetical protein
VEAMHAGVLNNPQGVDAETMHEPIPEGFRWVRSEATCT